MKRSLFLLVVLLLTLVSCKSVKEFAYFQDVDRILPRDMDLPEDVTFRKGDQLIIMVHSRDPELSKTFNLVPPQQVGGAQRESFYTINEFGMIDFPVLGEIKIEGMSRDELSKFIKSRLIEENLLKDPVVIVQYRNLSFYVLGSVRRTGRHEIDKDHLTILEAISLAGDLNVTGKRTNVLLIRDNYGAQVAYRLNLNSIQNIYESPAYYIQQNDIIYVEPSRKEARQSSDNASSFVSVSFWMSMVTFLLSLTTLFIKFK